MSDANLPSKDFRAARLCLLAVPVFSTIRWIGESNSNNYGESEYFLTYQHGFMKRALLGQLLSGFAYLPGKLIDRVEVGAVCLALIVSYVVFWRLLVRPGQSALWVVLLLCSPACLPHFSLMAAHPDTFLYIMALLSYLCLVRLRLWWSPIAAVVPCLVALLIHESFPLLFYPVILIILWDGLRTTKFGLGPVLIHLGCFGAVFLSILRCSKLPLPANVMLAEAQARTDILLLPGIFTVLSSSLSEQFNANKLLINRSFIGLVLSSLVLVAPLIAGYLVIALRLNRARSLPLPSFAIVSLLFLPLGLCFLGVDFFRWLAGSLVCLLLFIMYLIEEGGPEVRTALNEQMKPMGIALILYGLALGPMGGASVKVLYRLTLMLGAG